MLWGCSWSFLGCSWLPLAMLARMPKFSQELPWSLLGALGLLLELPGLFLAALSHEGQDAHI